jgi:hypothetical protein
VDLPFPRVSEGGSGALGACQIVDLHGATGTTHFSGWSWDRHVPSILHRAPFAPGEYHERVAPVDLAATQAC